MSKSAAECRCGFIFSGLEIGFFRILLCPACHQTYRWENTGSLVACDERGNRYPTEPVKEAPPEKEEGVIAMSTEAPVSVKEPVDVNVASAQDLSGVEGISVLLAARIVDYRQEKGIFTSLSALTKVKGLGPDRLSKIVDQLMVADDVIEAEIPPAVKAPPPNAKTERNEQLLTRWKDGHSPSALGKEFGISATRVRRILGDALMRDYRSGHLVESWEDEASPAE